jgi:outer membrane protein TolC
MWPAGFESEQGNRQLLTPSLERAAFGRLFRDAEAARFDAEAARFTVGAARFTVGAARFTVGAARPASPKPLSALGFRHFTNKEQGS